MRLIDGDALKQEFEDLAAIQWNKDTCTTCARAFKESAERVEDAKTVDAVERKKGKWRVVSRQTDSFTAYRCSECNELVYGKTNYCPRCGADMRGENNGNNVRE